MASVHLKCFQCKRMDLYQIWQKATLGRRNPVDGGSLTATTTRWSELPVVQLCNLPQRASLVWAQCRFAAHLLPLQRAVAAGHLGKTRFQSNKYLYINIYHNMNVISSTYFKIVTFSPCCWSLPYPDSLWTGEDSGQWFPPRRYLCSCCRPHNPPAPKHMSTTSNHLFVQNQQVPQCQSQATGWDVGIDLCTCILVLYVLLYLSAYSLLSLNLSLYPFKTSWSVEQTHRCSLLDFFI